MFFYLVRQPYLKNWLKQIITRTATVTDTEDIIRINSDWAIFSPTKPIFGDSL